MEHPELESFAADVHPGPTTPVEGPILSATPTASDPPATTFSASGKRLYTWDELPPKVRLQAEYEGKWVAWSADRETIVAAAEQLVDLDAAVKRTGLTGTLYEWLEPDPLPRCRL